MAFGGKERREGRKGGSNGADTRIQRVVDGVAQHGDIRKGRGRERGKEEGKKV